MKMFELTVATLAGVFASPAIAGMNFASLDFSNLDEDTAWGPGAPEPDPVGSQVLERNGISVTIADYLNLAQTPITSPGAFVGLDDSLYFEDSAAQFDGALALTFDSGGVPFDVERVEVTFVEFGGAVTLGVNGDVRGVTSFANAPEDLGGDDVSVMIAREDSPVRGGGAGVHGRHQLDHAWGERDADRRGAGVRAGAGGGDAPVACGRGGAAPSAAGGLAR